MVGPTPIEKFLLKHEMVALDTSIFIYFVEQHPSYFSLCDRILKDIETGHTKASTSSLSLVEVLVQPYRLNKDELVLRFYSLLTTYPNLSWIELTLSIADLAARLRAYHRLKTPDSIQVASAISSSATGFICNDPAFKRVKEIECLVLDELA